MMRKPKKLGSRDLVALKVPESFHMKLKIEAAQNHKTMTEYMRHIALEDSKLDNLFDSRGKNEKKKSFSLRF